jgi:glutamate N-acetyltransferase / amino-acid N-acetyltransferase
MEIIQDASITSVPGFRAVGVHCGLKKTDARDLALVVSDVPCRAAAAFTKNKVAAAPVQYDRTLLEEHRLVAQALVVNAGIANACTGERGLQDAAETSRHAARALGLRPEAVWVMSTGVIGQHLSMDKISAGVESAAERLSETGGHEAALAIMTTDTRPKEVAVRVNVAGKTVRIGGMCKGAGMIHPNMATMLCVIVTDALVAPDALQSALIAAVDKSFNMMTVDGDTSTNDTVLLLANGVAGNPEVRADSGNTGYAELLDGLTFVATELAKKIAADGEGASKFVEITVQRARTLSEAKTVAMAVAHSPLVKTAVYGQDANWGRVLCAVGYSGVDVDPEKLALWFGDLQLVKAGAPFDVNEARAAEILAKKEVRILVDLGQGDAEATVWTCDLTHGYIDINAHYRT